MPSGWPPTQTPHCCLQMLPSPSLLSWAYVILLLRPYCWPTTEAQSIWKGWPTSCVHEGKRECDHKTPRNWQLHCRWCRLTSEMEWMGERDRRRPVRTSSVAHHYFLRAQFTLYNGDKSNFLAGKMAQWRSIPAQVWGLEFDPQHLGQS